METGKDIKTEEILEKIKRKAGKLPKGMKYLGKLRPEMVKEHMRSKKFTEKFDSIPEKYQQLIIVASAVASGTPKCIETQVRIALNMGISEEEILDSIQLARFVLATTALANSADALKVVYEAK